MVEYPKPSLGCLLLHQTAWVEDISEENIFYCSKCERVFESNLHTNFDIIYKPFRKKRKK